MWPKVILVSFLFLPLTDDMEGCLESSSVREAEDLGVSAA